MTCPKLELFEPLKLTFHPLPLINVYCDACDGFTNNSIVFGFLPFSVFFHSISTLEPLIILRAVVILSNSNLLLFVVVTSGPPNSNIERFDDGIP